MPHGRKHKYVGKSPKADDSKRLSSKCYKYNKAEHHVKECLMHKARTLLRRSILNLIEVNNYYAIVKDMNLIFIVSEVNIIAGNSIE